MKRLYLIWLTLFLGSVFFAFAEEFDTSSGGVVPAVSAFDLILAITGLDQLATIEGVEFGTGKVNHFFNNDIDFIYETRLQ